MRTILCTTFVLLGLLPSTPSRAGVPAHFWSKRFGGTNTDNGICVAVDASGNIYVAGMFYGVANFGGADLTSAGLADIFLAKYDATGFHQWSQRFGSNGTDLPRSIAVDPNGDVILTGYFNGTVSFGGGSLSSLGFSDIFVAKYFSTGSHQWSKRFGSAGNDEGFSVSSDEFSNVLLTGYFTGTVSFGGGSLVSVGGNDIFLAKFNSSGTHQWSQRYGSTGNDGAYDVATDASFNVWMTGYFAGTVGFGGGNLTSNGGNDLFLAKFNSSGTHLFSQHFGGTDNDLGSALAIDASGNVVVAGFYLSPTIDFGGGNLTNGGFFDSFLAKFDSNGAHQWSRSFGADGADAIWGVTVDASGDATVTGGFNSTVDFGGGALTSAGGDDVFLAKYDASGAHLWSQRFGNTSADVGSGVAVNGAGHVVVTGSFTNNGYFGGSNLINAGFDDIFLATYSRDRAEPAISAVTDIGNDQGRSVRITIGHSAADDPLASPKIAEYQAYRRVDALPASPLAARAVQGAPPGLWEFVAAVPAHADATYRIVAPTLADSTIALGMHRSVFFVRAATADPTYFFNSAADSGYSLDNLAPGVPSSFAYTAGLLSWDQSKAADFDYFSVYGSGSSAFGSATLIDYTIGTGMDVATSPYSYFFLTATDFSGNEGKPAAISTLSGVGGPPQHYVLSVSAYPNPFNPATTVRYTVPARGRVTLSIYDLRGERVVTLYDGERAAGAYTETWNGRDGRGNPVTSGVYFGRLVSASGTRSYKLTLVK